MTDSSIINAALELGRLQGRVGMAGKPLAPGDDASAHVYTEYETDGRIVRFDETAAEAARAKALSEGKDAKAAYAAYEAAGLRQLATTATAAPNPDERPHDRMNRLRNESEEAEDFDQEAADKALAEAVKAGLGGEEAWAKYRAAGRGIKK